MPMITRSACNCASASSVMWPINDSSLRRSIPPRTIMVMPGASLSALTTSNELVITVNPCRVRRWCATSSTVVPDAQKNRLAFADQVGGEVADALLARRLFGRSLQGRRFWRRTPHGNRTPMYAQQLAPLGQRIQVAARRRFADREDLAYFSYGDAHTLLDHAPQLFLALLDGQRFGMVLRHGKMESNKENGRVYCRHYDGFMMACQAFLIDSARFCLTFARFSVK